MCLTAAERGGALDAIESLGIDSRRSSLPAQASSLWARLPTRDVDALAGVAVVAGDVPAAVDDAAHGLDAKVVVA